MFTGILDTIADVHQLTIILGHEMAHALLAHSVSKPLLAFSHDHCIVQDLNRHREPVALIFRGNLCLDDLETR